MENFWYAQINEDSICIAVSHMEETNNPRLIRLDEHKNVLGMKWTGSDWELVQIEQEEQEEQEEKSQEELGIYDLLTEIYFNQVYQMAIAEMEF